MHPRLKMPQLKLGNFQAIFPNFPWTLSPGQMDRQVVASGPKLNLRRDLRWVAKRNSKFARKYTQVAKKKF